MCDWTNDTSPTAKERDMTADIQKHLTTASEVIALRTWTVTSVQFDLFENRPAVGLHDSISGDRIFCNPSEIIKATSPFDRSAKLVAAYLIGYSDSYYGERKTMSEMGNGYLSGWSDYRNGLPIDQGLKAIANF